MTKLSRNAVKLNDLISDAELSTKLSGEEYSVLKTIHKTVSLGVHEVHDMSLWQMEEGESSVTFPHLSEAMSQNIFGSTAKVSFQVKQENVGKNLQTMIISNLY